MVDLETFIKEALVSISRGVEGAMSGSDNGQVKIGPTIEHGRKKGNPVAEKRREITLSHIEFDIAVTVETEKNSDTSADLRGKTSTGGIIKVIGADAQIEGSAQHSRGKTEKDSRTSRIKFSVPILFEGRLVKVPHSQ